MLTRIRTFALALLPMAWAAASTVRACDVPVFRFALERWRPDVYEAVLFHRGELTETDKRAAEALDNDSSTDGLKANLTLRLVDVSGAVRPADRELWGGRKTAELPRLVVTYPPGSRARGTAWAGRLSASAASALTNCPGRTEIVRRLTAGQAAVWVFLETGDAKQDDPVAALLSRELAAMPKRLNATAAPALRQSEDAPASPQRGIAFSMLRVGRDDAATRVLRTLLVRSEAGLETQHAGQPMVFPVFGRGRALYALVGKGINASNILEACRFLTGPCSCQVKAENPGVDLLIAADWDEALDDSWIDQAPAPLPSGLNETLEADKSATAPATRPASQPQAAPEEELPFLEQSIDLSKVVLITLAVVVVGVLILVLALARKSGAS